MTKPASSAPSLRSVTDADADADVFDELLELEFTIAGTRGESRFTIVKMPAMHAWDVLEEIRVRVGGTLDLSTAGGNARAAMAKIIGALPKPFVRKLRDWLYEHVTFTNTMAISPTVLKGNEDTALNAIDAEAVHVYEILVRSLAVNFTPSYRAIVAMIFPGRNRNSKQ